MDTSLRRYGGELVYHGRDQDGVLEVVDTYGIRALHFGTSPRQSAMALDNPERLELPYVRAMLSSLLFADEPRTALLAGLGGGSLARFLVEQFPGCQVEAVERRGGVVEIAHSYFGLPRVGRLAIHVADASQWVAAMARQARERYDLILVDAYDHLGMDASVNAQDFLDACVGLLRPCGVFSMNLWGTHPVALRQSVSLLNQCFPRRALKLAVPNRGNIIGLGLREGIPAFKPKQLERHARELEVRTGLEMSYFLRNLRPL